MRWLEDASLHLSIVVIPMQLSEKKAKHRTSIPQKFCGSMLKKKTKFTNQSELREKRSLVQLPGSLQHIKGNERD